MQILIGQKVWITILKTHYPDIVINKAKIWKCERVTQTGFCCVNSDNTQIPVLFAWEKQNLIFDNGNGFKFKIDLKNPNQSIFQKIINKFKPQK